MRNDSSANAMEPNTLRRLVWYFGIVYVAEGIAQVTGIINLPLTYYLSDELGWGATSISAYMGVLGWPWVVKPLYGLVSDCLPLWGYRRKSYLLLVNALAVGAFLWLACTNLPGQIIPALLVITTAMAASSTLCGAILVEHGRDTGTASKLCGHQSLWANIAKVSAGLLGGLVCYLLPPLPAFHAAALIALLAPLLVVLTTWSLVTENKAERNWQQFTSGFHGIWLAIKNPALWGVSVFLALWAFNPGFGTPLTLHMKDNLHFSKAFAGELASVFAAGSALGAYIYMTVLAPRFSVKTLTAKIIVLGAASQAAFIFMNDTSTALVLNFLFGMMTALAMLNAHVIAANKCPDRAEGFMYAILLSTSNLSFFGSQSIGGYLYEHVYDKQINGLILLSSAFTLACLLLLPFFNFERHSK